MKIILISGCFNCPHGARWNLEGTEYMCALKTKVCSDKKPPEWCPLQDAFKVAAILKKHTHTDKGADNNSCRQ